MRAFQSVKGRPTGIFPQKTVLTSRSTTLPPISMVPGSRSSPRAASKPLVASHTAPAARQGTPEHGPPAPRVGGGTPPRGPPTSHGSRPAPQPAQPERPTTARGAGQRVGTALQDRPRSSRGRSAREGRGVDMSSFMPSEKSATAKPFLPTDGEADVIHVKRPTDHAQPVHNVVQPVRHDDRAGIAVPFRAAPRPADRTLMRRPTTASPMTVRIARQLFSDDEATIVTGLQMMADWLEGHEMEAVDAGLAEAAVLLCDHVAPDIVLHALGALLNLSRCRDAARHAVLESMAGRTTELIADIDLTEADDLTQHVVLVAVKLLTNIACGARLSVVEGLLAGVEVVTGAVGAMGLEEIGAVVAVYLDVLQRRLRG